MWQSRELKTNVIGRRCSTYRQLLCAHARTFHELIFAGNCKMANCRSPTRKITYVIPYSRNKQLLIQRFWYITSCRSLNSNRRFEES